MGSGGSEISSACRRREDEGEFRVEFFKHLEAILLIEGQRIRVCS